MCPIFLYYSDGKPVYVIDGRDSVEEIIKAVINNKISWFVVNDSTDENFNFHALVKSATNSVLGTPISIGCSYAWKTDDLWHRDSR